MSTSYQLKFIRTTSHACVPRKGSPLAAGYDLASAYDCDIPPGGRGLVDTDLVLILPAGCYGRIAPRSGLAVKHAIDVGAGVIDLDYRGPIRILLINNGDKIFSVKRGDRVAQIICEKITMPDLEEIHEPIDYTLRGSKGFGSTGK